MLILAKNKGGGGGGGNWVVVYLGREAERGRLDRNSVRLLRVQQSQQRHRHRVTQRRVGEAGLLYTEYIQCNDIIHFVEMISGEG